MAKARVYDTHVKRSRVNISDIADYSSVSCISFNSQLTCISSNFLGGAISYLSIVDRVMDYYKACE